MKARIPAIVLVVATVLLLAGCGQKGPLYLPGDEPVSQTDGPFGSGSGEDSSSTEADARRTRSPLDD
ncbi:lipoprotein [Salinisphaera sp. T31B1]|uniref:LPS translocon maturation chaperone LptM n=1 Tax=Salinisphaera sp. T31B1 TaxID=727963 RepID=UPI00333E869E